MVQVHESLDTQHIAVVAIGRNEGRRMLRCLEAALRQAVHVIYIDSGSTDGSLERARELGAIAVPLDAGSPFTAARARNLGLAYVREHLPHVQLIQFLDADCEMFPRWLNTAAAKLSEDSTLAGVAGVLRELHPDASLYNRLCDMEWQAPAGESAAVGGNAMFRVAALADVGGYDPLLIAGEEPEMCVRLRHKGWRLWRLEAPMALHDAQMTRLSQWWKRAVRFGYAQTQVSQMHKGSPHRIWARQTRSTILWTLVPPLLAISATVVLAVAPGGWWWLLGLAPMLMYDLLALRIFIARRQMGQGVADSFLYATATTLAKFPQFVGAMRYLRRRRTGLPGEIIEYKDAADGTQAKGRMVTGQHD